MGGEFAAEVTAEVTAELLLLLLLLLLRLLLLLDPAAVGDPDGVAATTEAVPWAWA